MVMDYGDMKQARYFTVFVMINLIFEKILICKFKKTFVLRKNVCKQANHQRLMIKIEWHYYVTLEHDKFSN